MGPDDLFQTLAGAVEDLVYVWRPTGEMVWTNETFVRETGLTVEDFGFRNQENPFIHPDDLASVLEAMGAFQASDARRSTPIRNRFIDAWGRIRAVSSTVTKIEWEGAAALLIVSRLVPTEGANVSPDEQHRLFMEAADDGILELSQDGQVLYSNRRFQQLYGARPVEIARRPFTDFFEPDDRARAAQALAQLRTDRTPVAFEARLAPVNGARRWLAVHVSPVVQLHGAAQMLVIARDVTDARALEDRLRQRQRLESLGVLVGGIAHDLNNIITCVLANASFAGKLVPAETELAEVLRDIRLAGERARNLNASLLAYAGKAPTEIGIVDLTRVTDDTLRILGSVADWRVRFERLGRGTPPVRADAGQLGQVVLNLLTNAADAMGSRPGRVVVETRTTDLLSAQGDDAQPPTARWLPDEPLPGRYAHLTVRDEGLGMTAETREKIFDPFFTTKERGRGLGLSAVRGIVERHEGYLRVVSEPGQGTTFEILIPAVPEQRAARPQPATQPPRLDGSDGSVGSILIVDDEPQIRSAGQRLLEHEGYDVVVAADATEGLTAFAAAPQRFALAIIDYAMPGMNGQELARRLRAIRPDLPIVQASGWSDETLAEGAVERVVYLAKPFRFDELMKAVTTATATAKSS